MLEHLNLCLLCVLFPLIFYPHVQTKKYFTLLKMAEEIFSGVQSDTKRQKLLNLTGNSKLYLGKVYTEEQLKNLAKKKWKNFLIIMKPSSQARW